MYNHKFVAAIKSNNKVLREFKDTVYIPFGSEYSVYLKNLNSVRAEVDISIDGTTVSDNGLVINANSELNIERFIKDLSCGNKFKFIERTGKIEKHRGVKAEDGLIRIAFKFEKVFPKPVWPYYAQSGHWEWKPGYPLGSQPPQWSQPSWITTNAVGTSNCNINNSTICATSAVNCNVASIPQGPILRGVTQNSVFTSSTPDKEVGITVPGSESNQKFQTVSSFITEDEEHVMILRLLGETESGKEVKAPVTVKTKARCVTCGRNNKATAHFCVDCGTSLSIL